MNQKTPPHKPWSQWIESVPKALIQVDAGHLQDLQESRKEEKDQQSPGSPSVKMLEGVGGLVNFQVKSKDTAPTDASKKRDNENSWDEGAKWHVQGHRRSYSNVALSGSQGVTLSMENCRGIIDFDPLMGTMTAWAGTSLKEILDVTVPHGWALEVTPGTSQASLGGCIASDVHGKNHAWRGCFGNHVMSMEVWRSDRGVFMCHPQDQLWGALIGGLGATGMIRSATLQLKKIETNALWVTHQTLKNWEDFLIMTHQNQKSESSHPRFHGDQEYTVAWIDALAQGKHLGRGWFEAAHHATLNEWRQARGYAQGAILESGKEVLPWLSCKSMEDSTWNMPSWPSSWIRPTTVKMFNEMQCQWSRLKTRQGSIQGLKSMKSFFYPLDGLNHWYRLYGPRGFMQYQVVLPWNGIEHALPLLLEQIARSQRGSSLTVLKSFGAKESRGWMSFPHDGVTLAMDFACDRDHDPHLMECFKRWDRAIAPWSLNEVPRHYASKSPHLTSKHMESYVDYEKWKEAWDPQCQSQWMEQIQGRFNPWEKSNQKSVSLFCKSLNNRNEINNKDQKMNSHEIKNEKTQVEEVSQSVKKVKTWDVAVIAPCSGMIESAIKAWAKEGKTMLWLGRSELKMKQLKEKIMKECEQEGLDVGHCMEWKVIQEQCIESVFLEMEKNEEWPIQWMVALGQLKDQKQWALSVNQGWEDWNTNAHQTIEWLQRAYHHTLKGKIKNQGIEKGWTVAVISSVAGDVIKPSNWTYGAAKRAVSAFMEGLRFEGDQNGIACIDIKPGFVATPMTAHMKTQGLLWTSAEKAGLEIMKIMRHARQEQSQKASGVYYVPGYWKWILRVMMHVPRVILKRM